MKTHSGKTTRRAVFTATIALVGMMLAGTFAGAVVVPLVSGPSLLAADAQAAKPTTLGSITLPRKVMADGKPLAAGTYQVRLTEDMPSQAAPGASANLEKFVEFVQGGQVKGREVASLIPDPELKEHNDKSAPKAGSKVELLKGGEYMRVWIHREGTSYLIHLPTA